MKKKELSRIDQLRLLSEEVNTKLGAEGKVVVGRDFKEDIVRIPTGLLALDTLLGGGLPRKRYVEFYGEYSAAKTTLALLCVKAVQKAGGIAGWVIGEEFDDDWAERQGVDLDKLVKIEALTGDLMLETAVTYLESGLVDLLVLDSIQALGTKREYDAGVDQEAYAGGGAPQMWGRFYRRTRSSFNSGKSDACIIGISQVRAPIGKFSPAGQPEAEPTQIKAILHWKAVSIQCKKGEPTYDDPKSEKKKLINRQFKLRCMKNKTAPAEGRVSSYNFRFRKPKGFDYYEEAIRLGKVYGLLQQGGKVLTGYGIKVAGSKGTPAVDLFIKKLKEDPDLLEALRQDILEACEER